jgi:hypothetical protein
MNFVSSVWGFYLVWGGMMGVGANLGLTIAIDKALTDWFVRKIGLAIGTKFAVIGVVSAVSIPVISWLIAQVGQYNFVRSLKRKELFAAHYAEAQFCADVISLVFLLNRKYAPFYK